jgi:aryl-alcohol dehydrogenase
MDIQAAVVREKGGPFAQETLRLDVPASNEVLVRIVATGMCNSDLAIVHQHFPLPLPWVLGHEGSGIIERVGSGVRHLAPGDPVVLTFDSCGACRNCETGHPAYCEHWFALNATGRRRDGRGTFTDMNHEHVNGCHFGQSSFANYALASSRNAIKVRTDAPLELLGPLGCGIQTGAGTVLNVLRPEPDNSLAVFGAGAVGLAAVMAARIAGCHEIIVVDRIASRLELALSLGATSAIDAAEEDPIAAMSAKGGVDYCIEATGIPTVAQQATQVLRPRGRCVLLGTPRMESRVLLDLLYLSAGRAVCCAVEGDADPQIFIPYLVDQFMAGRLPIDKLTRFYPLADINQAMADSESGVTVKPILRIA